MIEQLKEFAHSKLLIAQRLNRVVSSDDFARAVELADCEQRTRLRSLIDRMDLDPLKNLIRELLMNDLESLSYRALRELGKRYHVRYWHTLPKESLIWEIENARTKSDSANVNSDS